MTAPYPHSPRPGCTWKHRWVWLACMVCMGLLHTACPARALLTHKQLGGADPNADLAATPQIQAIPTRKVTDISVRGIKLLDPLARVFELWGKPTSDKKRRYTWTDPQGTYRLRVLVGRKMLASPNKLGKRWDIVVRQIDIFSTFSADLHPLNRALLDPEMIRSPSWRNQTFGSRGKQEQSHLKEWFTFPKRGFRFVVISQLLPLHKKIRAVFSLFIPEEDLTQLRVIPI